MYRHPSPALVVLSFLLALSGIGCNNESSTRAPAHQPGLMTTSLPTAVVGTAYSFTMQATGGTGAYTWSISGGTLPTWASLEAGSGTISGMPDTAETTTFSVAVMDEAGLSDIQSLNLVVKPALAISTTSLPNGSIDIPYDVTLKATGGIWPYTWSISSGSLPSWANLDSGGRIRGTPDANGVSNFTIEVGDSQATPASTTQALSITVAAPDSTNNAELKGQYAFLFQGFDDATGNQFAVIGSFIAEGDGTISGGLEDVNGASGYHAALTLTGAYNVGADNRGIATFTSTLGTTRFAIAVGSLDSGNVATRGSLIEFDDTTGTSGKHGSGFLYLQNPNTFHLLHLVGPYAFLFAGQTQQSATRLAFIGAYTADGNGNVTNGQVDSNIDGVMASAQAQAFTATIAETAQTGAFGRMTVTPSNLANLHFVYYIVTDDRTLAMSTEPESQTGLVAGEVLQQKSVPYSAASLSGTAVGYGVGKLSLNAGLWTFDGAADANYSLAWSDQHYIYLGPMMGSLSYAVATNGRVTTAGGGTGSGVPGQPILYLVDSNKGFLMSTDASVSAGFLEEQTDAPFSNGTVTGTYVIGTVPPAVSSSTVVSGVGTSAGDGVLDMVLDTSDPVDLLRAGVNESWYIDIDTTGHWSDLDLSAEGGIYLVSRKKAVVLMNARGWPMITIFQQ